MGYNILGIHGFSANSDRQLHDTGASLIRDGKIIASVNEERLSRQKKDGSFPFQSIENIFSITDTNPDKIDYVAFADESPIWQIKNISKYLLKTYLKIGFFPFKYLMDSIQRTFDLTRRPPRELLKKPVMFIEHHKAHAASAFYTSPWRSATIITIDGMGDYCIGGIVGFGKENRINILKRTNGFFSPGIFYTSITNYLGFKPGFHEGKVTGLAAYGSPEPAYPSMKTIISYEQNSYDFHSKDIPKMLNKLDNKKVLNKLSSYSREEIAAAAQKRLEDIILNFVNDAIKLTGNRRLVLAGGIFANVRLNQKISEMDCVDGLYVFPAMNDSGLASGAALYTYYQRNKRPFPIKIDDLFLGPEFNSQQIKRTLNKFNLCYKKINNIEEYIANAIVENKIVGHFYGRMEYGPRALGNRSILASPKDISINESLNKRLHRTEFMPFAPSILSEYAKEFLEGYSPEQILSKYMVISYNVKPIFKKNGPAAVHIDGTARPQIVHKKDNPRFHKIISRYFKKSGIPFIINTSFNMHEEPIVCSPKDAIRSYLEGAVDVLIIGDYVVIGKNNGDKSHILDDL